MSSKRKLFRAIFKGDLNTVSKLVQERPKLANAVNEDLNDSSALHISCAEGEFEIAKFLVSQGADCMSLDGNDATPLHQLASNHRIDEEFLSLLVEKMENAIDVEDINQATPLFEACQTPCVAMVRYLLAKGANPRQRNEFGETLLHAASVFPNIFVKNLLDGTTVDVEAKNDEGVTGLAAWNEAITTLPGNSFLHDNPQYSENTIGQRVCAGATVVLRLEIDGNDDDDDADDNDDDDDDDDADDGADNGNNDDDDDKDAEPVILVLRVKVLAAIPAVEDNKNDNHRNKNSSDDTNKSNNKDQNDDNKVDDNDNDDDDDDDDEPKVEFHAFIIEEGVQEYVPETNNENSNNAASNVEKKHKKRQHGFIPGFVLSFAKVNVFEVIDSPVPAATTTGAV